MIFPQTRAEPNRDPHFKLHWPTFGLNKSSEAKDGVCASRRFGKPTKGPHPVGPCDTWVFSWYSISYMWFLYIYICICRYIRIYNLLVHDSCGKNSQINRDFPFKDIKSTESTGRPRFLVATFEGIQFLWLRPSSSQHSTGQDRGGFACLDSVGVDGKGSQILVQGALLRGLVTIIIP